MPDILNDAAVFGLLHGWAIVELLRVFSITYTHSQTHRTTLSDGVRNFNKRYPAPLGLVESDGRCASNSSSTIGVQATTQWISSHCPCTSCQSTSPVGSDDPTKPESVPEQSKEIQSGTPATEACRAIEAQWLGFPAFVDNAIALRLDIFCPR